MVGGHTVGSKSVVPYTSVIGNPKRIACMRLDERKTADLEVQQC